MWYQLAWYESWAPVVARLLLAVPFIVGTLFKLPWTEGFAPQVEATAAVGVPLAAVAVFLAFLLELALAISFILGYRTRLMAAIAVPYVILLTALFHHTFATPTDLGFFIDHLVFIAALLYLSVYGPGRLSLKAK